MHFSPALASPITHTRMRNPNHVADISGMCAVCAAECTGPCEIGLSAIRGAEAILPFSADKNQFASEKKYPLDFSHFNINGRVFGAVGLPPDPDKASYPFAGISSSFGTTHAVAIKGPFILPAMAKLAWKEYFAGAAISGVPVVIGEDVIAKDPGLVVNGHRVVASPLIAEMVSTFRRYQRDFGDIVLQANFDDENHGVLEYAIDRLGIKSVELKFGQAAKGIQGMSRVPDILEKAEKPLPPIAMAGGFATEDQIYKGLALGAPYVRMIAIGRAAMAAASVGRQVGQAIRNGSLPKEYAHFGSTVEEIFADFRLLKAEYGDRAADIPTGAIGLYSYLNRISVGLKQFMALNRKFTLRHIDRGDIVPLTDHSAKVTGLATYDERTHLGG